MQSLTADNAKRHFGELLLKAQQGPVQISRNGKPVAVVVSHEEYDAMDQVKLKLLQLRAAEAATGKNLIETDAAFTELLKDM